MFPREPVKLAVVLTGHTAGEPVIMFPGVYDHEVPLVMSPVLQATGWRIVHTWVYERQDRNIITVGDKHCRCGEVLFQPKTSIRSRTFRCLRRTLPFRGTLVRHETGTSSLFTANASISRKSCLYQVPLVYVQRIQ